MGFSVRINEDDAKRWEAKTTRRRNREHHSVVWPVTLQEVAPMKTLVKWQPISLCRMSR